MAKKDKPNKETTKLLKTEKKTIKPFSSTRSAIAKIINIDGVGDVNKVFQNSDGETVRFHSTIVKFSQLYKTQNKWIRYLLAVSMGIVAGIFALFFIQNTGLYQPGLGGALQGVARLVQTEMLESGSAAGISETVYNVLFWGLYLIANIPLCIFAYYKINKQFAYLTILFIIGAQVTGFLLSMIPNIDEQVMLGQCDLSLFKGTWNENNGMPKPEWNYIEQHYDVLIRNNIQMLDWGNPAQAAMVPQMFLYVVMGAIGFALPVSLLYIVGGSSGGADIVSFYYAKKKNKPVGNILTYLNVVTLIIGILLGSFIPAGMINGKYFAANYLFSPNMMCSLLLSALMGIIFNFYFPKHKTVKVQIYSTKVMEIRDNLMALKYNHALTINNSIGGYSLKENKNFYTICMFVELPELIYAIRKIDKDCLIVTTRVIGLDGFMAVRK